MPLADYLPLLTALAAIGLVALAPLVGGVDRAFTRLALSVFGGYVRSREREGLEWSTTASRRADLLRAAHFSATYRVYASKSFLYATVLALAGSVIGVYLVFGLFEILAVPEETLRGFLPDQMAFLAGSLSAPELTTTQLFAILLASNATLGTVMGVTIYRLRWWWPDYVAVQRERRIDASIQRTIAFLYALSRSGMEFPEVLGILADNRAVFGEAASEVEIVVRDMRFFGTDVLEGLERLSTRTPSDRFGDFADNLVSVLRSGRSLSLYLHEQYEQYKDETETTQEEYLALLATLSEMYVTALVAGPLFLITILVIIGLIVGGTLAFLQLLVYLLLPLGTLGFVFYLASLSNDTDLTDDVTEGELAFGQFADVRRAEAGGTRPARAEGGGVGPSSGVAGATDGGWTDRSYPTTARQRRLCDDATSRNEARLNAYHRLKWLYRRLRDPVGLVLRSPTALLYVTVPLAVIYVLVRVGPQAMAGTLTLATFDDVAVQAVLFLVGSFALVHEVYSRRINDIERAIPDFLDRLASVNEAGVPIVASFGQVSESNLGELNEELDRTWADIQWGASAEDALHRLSHRIGTSMVTRAVTLITNAMRVSGNIGPVLRIAADDAQASRRLERKRKQELVTYLIVIYLAFFVFLAIVIALQVIFLPSIPTLDNVGSDVGGVGAVGGIGGMGLGGIDAEQKASYELLFFHASLVQGFSSGMVAGQMSENSVLAGAKHATVMLTIAYVLFVVLT